MQKITVLGKKSAAKKAMMGLLESKFKVTDLLPEQVGIKDMSPASLIVYFDEESDQQNISMVNFNSSSLVPSQLRRSNLSVIQRKVLLQLAKGLPDEDNWNSLRLSRSQYFNVLSQLRIIFNVKKNWELTQLAMDLDNPKF
jgi:hypothetical protein